MDGPTPIPGPQLDEILRGPYERFIDQARREGLLTPPPRAGEEIQAEEIAGPVKAFGFFQDLFGGIWRTITGDDPGLLLYQNQVLVNTGQQPQRTPAGAAALLGNLANPKEAMITWMRLATQFLGGLVKNATRVVLGEQAAATIDDGGDIFRLVGSLQDVIVDENRLTAGPLSFPEVLQYENRLSGMRVVFVLSSFFYAAVVNVLSIGIVKDFSGLLVHLVDDVIGDNAKVVSTQLVRRAVGEPYESGYARIHRGKDLSTSEAEESYALGLIDEDRFVDLLVTGGFKDQAIQDKVQLGRVRAKNQAGVFPIRTKFIPPSTLTSAFRSGVVSQEEFLSELARQGYDDTALSIFWTLALEKIPPEAVPGA